MTDFFPPWEEGSMWVDMEMKEERINLLYYEQNEIKLR